MTDDDRERRIEGPGGRLEAFFDAMASEDLPLIVERLEVNKGIRRPVVAPWAGAHVVSIAAAMIATLLLTAALLFRGGTGLSTTQPLAPSGAPSTDAPSSAPPDTSATSARSTTSTTSTAGTAPGSRPSLSTPATPTTSIPSGTCTDAPAPTGSLLAADFCGATVGQPPPAPWVAASGAWTIVAGGSGPERWAADAVPPGSGAESRLAAGGAEWTDYTITARVRVGTGVNAVAGVAARFQDANRYYFCKFGPQYGGLYAGAFDGAAPAAPAGMDFATPAGTEWTVRLTVRGTTLECSIDGTVARVTTTSTAWPKGGVALLSQDGSQFTQVSVSP